jgi:hypothetical protein
MSNPAIIPALPFAGAIVGAFACTIALLSGESFCALAAIVMTVYCTGEFVVNVDVT